MNDNDLKINEYPSIFWAKFFYRFPEIETLPIKEWKVLHLLSYFSKKYQDHYGVKYSFKFNTNSPTKSYEVFQVRKLGQILSAQPEILKDYIDWFFETKIILKKKRITSLSFLTDTNTANEYKFKKLGMNSGQSVDRTTTLPSNILEIPEINCKTYGDLAFLIKSGDGGIILKLKEAGFDLSVLDKVK